MFRGLVLTPRFIWGASEIDQSDLGLKKCVGKSRDRFTRCEGVFFSLCRNLAFLMGDICLQGTRREIEKRLATEGVGICSSQRFASLSAKQLGVQVLDMGMSGGLFKF